MRSKPTNILLALVLALAVFSGRVHAQTAKSTLSGVVSDPDRAPIQGAVVVVTATATGVSRTVTTDSAGNYVVSNLDPGEYFLRATANRFPPRTVEAIVLSVGGTTVLGVTMTAEEERELTVVYHEPLIDATSGDRSRVVRSQEIDMLPNRGRNFVDFVKLTGAAAQGRENVGGGPFKEPDTGVGASAVPRLSFGGQSELNTVLQVDGADNIQTMTGLPRATPSQEAAGEFRVLSTTYSPQYGGALVGFVNIVTKSGENSFHGSVYYYGTNDILNARPSLNTASASALRQNQYGVTLGGPIKRDRAFFFANWEGQRRVQSNAVPQVVQNNLELINAVRTQYGLSKETNNQERTSDYDLAMIKVNYQISQANSVMARYNFQTAEALRFPGLFGRGAPTSSAARNTDLQDQTLVGSALSVLSSRTVNEARVQWARRTFDYQPTVSEPNLEISNLIAMGKSTSDPSYYAETRRQFTDNLTFSKRGHDIKAGFDFAGLDDSTIYPLFFGGYGIFASRLANSIAQLFTSTEFASKGNLPDAQLLFPNSLPLAGRFDQNTVSGPAAQAAAITFLRTGQYPAPTRNGMANTLDREMKTPYARNGSFQIEHEFHGVVVSLGYQSVAARDLIGYGANLNAVQTDTLASGKPYYGARKYADMGDYIAATNCGVSDYNGATVEISRRFAKGFGFQASYTFSKTMSNGDSIANFADDPEWNPALEFGVSRQHVPHRLTLGWMAEIPQKVRLIRGLQFNSVVTVQSGRFNTVFAGSDANGDGNPNSDRPGTLGRNTMQGPGTESIDLRLSRAFPFGERARLIFSVDAFNLLNHMNVTEIGTLWGSPSLSVTPSPLLGFGSPVGVSNSREVQGSLKLRF